MKKKDNDKEWTALVKAAEAYVKSIGGKIVVAGPIEIIQWPDDGPYKYTLGIKCLGKAPTKKVLDKE